MHRDGKHLVAAVFGGDTAGERNARMQSLLKRLRQGLDEVTRKPALVARAPQPARAARPSVQVAEAAKSQPRPPPAAAPPSSRERETSIAVARVRPVRIGSDPRGARLERIELAPSAPQPVFAVAGMGGSMPPPHAPNPSDQTFPRFVPETGALQPSTLQAQAAQLEAGNEPPDPRPLAALAPEKPRAAVARSRGPFEIQIGAFW